MKKENAIEDIECESCADHVCNDFCGCILSLAAIESKKRDDIREFEKLFCKIKGMDNILEYYFCDKEYSLIIKLKEMPNNLVVLSTRFKSIEINEIKNQLKFFSEQQKFDANKA